MEMDAATKDALRKYAIAWDRKERLAQIAILKEAKVLEFDDDDVKAALARGFGREAHAAFLAAESQRRVSRSVQNKYNEIEKALGEKKCVTCYPGNSALLAPPSPPPHFPPSPPPHT